MQKQISLIKQLTDEPLVISQYYQFPLPNSLSQSMILPCKPK